LFVAKLEEAQSIHSQRDLDLACHSSFSDNDGMSLYGHNQRSLCTMGHLQQLRCAEGNTFYCTFRGIPSATGANDLLLFSHCLLTIYQGKSSTLSVTVTLTSLHPCV